MFGSVGGTPAGRTNVSKLRATLLAFRKIRTRQVLCGSIRRAGLDRRIRDCSKDRNARRVRAGLVVSSLAKGDTVKIFTNNLLLVWQDDHWQKASRSRWEQRGARSGYYRPRRGNNHLFQDQALASRRRSLSAVNSRKQHETQPSCIYHYFSRAQIRAPLRMGSRRERHMIQMETILNVKLTTRRRKGAVKLRPGTVTPSVVTPALAPTSSWHKEATPGGSVKRTRHCSLCHRSYHKDTILRQ